MKTIEVVFTGAAREITKEKSIRIVLDDQSTYRNVIGILASRFPGLVGTLISADQRSLLSANLFNRNGEEPVMPDHMDLCPQDGERIVMLYFIVGGCGHC
jgi:hypothetical protein